MTRQINDAGMDLIKSFEGCRLTAYQDQVGVWSIGWGDTGPDVVEGLTITQDDADTRLAAKLDVFCSCVERDVKVDLTDNEFAALVSLCYNIGSGNFWGSTLLKLLNAGDFENAADQFLVWDHAAGQVDSGLSRRRIAERNLFLT